MKTSTPIKSRLNSKRKNDTLNVSKTDLLPISETSENLMVDINDHSNISGIVPLIGTSELNNVEMLEISGIVPFTANEALENVVAVAEEIIQKVTVEKKKLKCRRRRIKDTAAEKVKDLRRY